MAYLPHTEHELEEMLSEIGVSQFEELLEPIPSDVRLEESLNLPEALSEQEVLKHVQDLARDNRDVTNYTSFLGAGMYQHFVPAVVDELTKRNEFYTAYTPYQAEASQGILQVFYEYQTLICELTGMDVSNASHYDGPTALAEAVLMLAGTEEGTILVPEYLHPEYIRVLETYLQFHPLSIRTMPARSGRTDPDAFVDLLDDDISAVVLQHPNFLGFLEPAIDIGSRLDDRDIPLIGVTDPISSVELKPPGHWGADVAVGEGQSLGNHLYFGGPTFGFISTREENIRKIPGRLVGQTETEEGDTAYVLTLQTREQHIRREKATSNICTNQGLNALQATVWMCALGRQGMYEVADHCFQKSHYLHDRLLEVNGISRPFDDEAAPFFREFVVDLPLPVRDLNKHLLDHDFIGGLDVSHQLSEVEHPWLLTATEWPDRAEIDQFVHLVEEYLSSNHD